MSVDLIVLTPGSATDYDHAFRVSHELELGDPDEDRINAFADELKPLFRERHRPFAGNPILSPTHIVLAIAAEAWEEFVPEIVERAHRHDLVVLDLRSERLFPPGTGYEASALGGR